MNKNRKEQNYDFIKLCILYSCERNIKRKKMTQYKLEQLTGIYHSTMNAIMNDRCKSSNFKTMALIIRELGMNIPEFFNSPIFANFDNLNIDD